MASHAAPRSRAKPNETIGSNPLSRRAARRYETAGSAFDYRSGDRWAEGSLNGRRRTWTVRGQEDVAGLGHCGQGRDRQHCGRMVTATVATIADGVTRERGVVAGHTPGIRRLPSKPARRADASVGEVVSGAGNRQRGARQEERQHPSGQAS